MRVTRVIAVIALVLIVAGTLVATVACGTKYSLTISVTGQGTTNPIAGTYNYKAGQTVTITATPNSTWKFDNWSGDASGTSATTTVKMDSDKTVVANFSPNYVPKSSNLVNGAITVTAGNYYDASFSVDTSTMHDVTVLGSFTASGGSGNDVEVFIMDDTNFTNWKNGHSYAAIYTSGRVTTDSINVAITASGNYHLVYSNTFSWISTKTVSTNVDLKWSELE